MYELLVEQGKQLETNLTLSQTQHNLFYLFILSSTWAFREKEATCEVATEVHVI